MRGENEQLCFRLSINAKDLPLQKVNIPPWYCTVQMARGSAYQSECCHGAQRARGKRILQHAFLFGLVLIVGVCVCLFYLNQRPNQSGENELK